MAMNCGRAALLAVVAGAPCVGQIAPGPVWVRQFGTAEYDSAWAAAAGHGRVYVVGDTAGSYGGTNVGSTDAHLTCVDAQGAIEWVRQIGSREHDGARGVAVIGDAVYVAGWANAALEGPWQGRGRGFLACFNADGSTRWIDQFGASQSDVARAIADDGGGGAFVAGHTGGALAGPNQGGDDVFLARYDGAGNRLWVRQFGTPGSDLARAAAPDGVGGLYAAGRTAGLLPGSTGTGQAWIGRFDGDGDPIWIRQFGTSNSDWVDVLAADGAGGVLVSGRLDHRLFVGRYSAEGEQIRLDQLLAWSVPNASSTMAPDGMGGVYVGWVDIYDGLGLARVDGVGQAVWTLAMDPGAESRVGGLASDGLGGVYWAGYTYGSLGGPSVGTADVVVMRFPGPTPACYANCDYSTAAPALTVADFVCFLERYAVGDPYANCDGSSVVPVLNVGDLSCFLERYASGCR